MLELLKARGAQYPAEHNVGHLYEAPESLQQFYRQNDPTNSMNPGIGKTSKQKYWGEAAPDASLSGGSAIIDGRTIQPGASVLRCTPENVSPADSGAPPCPQRPRYSTVI